MKKSLLDKVLKMLLIMALIVTFFRLAPAAIVTSEHNRTVLVSPSKEIRYFPEDGSFIIGPISGCLRWYSCGINEPTDWYAVVR